MRDEKIGAASLSIVSRAKREMQNEIKYVVQMPNKPEVVMPVCGIGQQHLLVIPGSRSLTVLFLLAWLRLPKLSRPELFTLRNARSP